MFYLNISLEYINSLIYNLKSVTFKHKEINYSTMIDAKSLICGELTPGSEKKEAISPIDNNVIANIGFLSDSELLNAFKSAKKGKDRKEKKDFTELIELAN